MDAGDNFFSHSIGAGRILQTSSSNPGNPLWDLDAATTSRFNWITPGNAAERAVTGTSDAVFFSNHGGGGGTWAQPDPQLVCLRLGKRHYFENEVGGFSAGKKGKIGGEGEAVAAATAVPRCQVEGCQVALVNAKEYHKRHKVCEMHSKAPKVRVLGLEQRFCQQCSRFHAVSEFDDSKRSCRRRLAGHNERRRKSAHDSNSKHPSPGRALSLLSYKGESWVSSSDLSLRSSAALRELMAENRAAILARQLIREHEWQLQSHHMREDLGDSHLGFNSVINQQQHHHATHEPSSWERFQDNGTHVTLDLMEAPSSAYNVSVTGKSKEDEDCSALWNSLEGSHHVL